MSLPATKTDKDEQASLLAKPSPTDGRTPAFLRLPQRQPQLQYGSTTRATTTPRQPQADDEHPPLFSSSLPHVNRVKKRAWSIHSEEEDKGQEEEKNLGSSAHRESLVRAMREYLGGGTTAADHEVGGAAADGEASAASSAAKTGKAFLYYIVYAIVNVIISGMSNGAAIFCNFCDSPSILGGSTDSFVCFPSLIP